MSENKKEKKFTLNRLAEITGAQLVGDGSLQVTGVAGAEEATPAEISFVLSEKHLPKAKQTNAGALIVKEKIDAADFAQLIVGNVNKALISVAQLFSRRPKPAPGIDPTAIITKSACIGEGASIGPAVTISAGARIGKESVISSGCRIGENVTIGDHTRLDSNVVVYYDVTIGDHCVIQANTAIGSTGFGYYFIEGQNRLIPHTGTVVIEDFVEIGANCCVDRAKFGETRIGKDTKVDNLVQIAHNVEIGEHSLIAAQVGIAGSSKIGNGVIIAGMAGISDHVTINDGAMVGGGSAVIREVAPGQQIWGEPAIELKDRMRQIAALRRLPQQMKEIKTLVKRLEKLEASKDNKQ